MAPQKSPLSGWGKGRVWGQGGLGLGIASAACVYHLLVVYVGLEELPHEFVGTHISQE